MFKLDQFLLNNMSAKNLLIVVGLIVVSHVIASATNVPDPSNKNFKELASNLKKSDSTELTKKQVSNKAGETKESIPVGSPTKLSTNKLVPSKAVSSKLAADLDAAAGEHGKKYILVKKKPKKKKHKKIKMEVYKPKMKYKKIKIKVPVKKMKKKKVKGYLVKKHHEHY